MIEKPNISDEKIVAVVQDQYSIPVAGLEFLPIGNDASAFSYRVEAKDGNLYFLKVKTKVSNLGSLFVPKFLKDHGVKQVVAPLSSNTQNLLAEMDGFSIILYPFVAGQEAMNIGMTDSQWIELGSVLKQIHHTELPSDLLQFVGRETFNSKWMSFAKGLHARVNTPSFDDTHQKELAAFWKKNNQIIRTLLERAETIGERLQQANLGLVLCHADIHTANILITDETNMFLVDWDDTLLAPKEWDLMFILDADSIRTPEEQRFFEGYGTMEIHPLALAYYRYEWCVQEIGDFGQRVFLTEDVGESTKQNALEEFMKLFSQGDVIEAALNTPFELQIRNHS
jgi:spectinomycin phosphotransferase